MPEPRADRQHRGQQQNGENPSCDHGHNVFLRGTVTMRFPAFLLTLAMAASAIGADWNRAVLDAVRSMPEGGGYSVTREAGEKLRSSAQVSDGKLVVRPEVARPSYCSGATYLVFLKVVAEAHRRGELQLDKEVLKALLPAAQRDGHGVWGRWNANGPGTARWFHELGLGRNFTSFEEARPGDFMKIFWRDAVGANERGHLVIYLGTETIDGREHVRFWSSNKPGGFGEKSVPRSSIARALFSRLERPERLANVSRMPAVDTYLAGLLEKESSFAEACRLSGVE